MMVSKKKGIHPRQYQKSVVDKICEDVNQDVISFIEEEMLLAERNIITESTCLKYGYRILKYECNRVGEIFECGCITKPILSVLNVIHALAIAFFIFAIKGYKYYVYF